MENSHKIAFVTGITGQDGSFLAEFLLSKGYAVHGLVRRNSSTHLARIEHLREKITLHWGDLTDGLTLAQIVERISPDEVYNLGAQSHVHVSFENPVYTADATGTGAIRLLEAIKQKAKYARVYQAGSSEMFGISAPPLNEQTRFHPRSIYACAKACAHYAAVQYREAFDMFVCNGILFNHECLTAETPIVYRINGSLIHVAEIQDLVPHRTNAAKGHKYQSQPRGLEVWDGRDWTYVTCATATWDVTKKVYSVEARGGLYCATGEHRSFLDDRQPVRTDKLKCGQKLQLFPTPSTTGQISISELESKFLGMMAGDGHIAAKRSHARFTNLNPTLRKCAADAFCLLTGGNSREDFSKRSGYTGNVVPSVEFSSASEWFALWRQELYDERGKKRVPYRILNAPLAAQQAFLDGYNSANGLTQTKLKKRYSSWKTNSPCLAQGLYLLASNLGLRLAVYKDRDYCVLNIGDFKPPKGKHLLKPLETVRKATCIPYKGWLFDLETESGTFSAGIGQTWVHNSERRGENFVTRKVTKAVANIKKQRQDKLLLGNLTARRDWGYAGEYVEVMWLMLQQSQPDDFVIGTGVSHSVDDFVNAAFAHAGLDPAKYVEMNAEFNRPSDIPCLTADITKAKRVLGWEPIVTFEQLVKLMVDHDLKQP